MKKLLLILTMLAGVALGNVQALDLNATLESAWDDYVRTERPEPITEERLRSAIELAVFQGVFTPPNKATPYGILYAKWDATIHNFGLPAVADEYVNFLFRLRAELEKEKQNKQNGSN